MSWNCAISKLLNCKLLHNLDRFTAKWHIVPNTKRRKVWFVRSRRSPFPTPFHSTKPTLLKLLKTSLSNSCAHVNISESMQIVWLMLCPLNGSPVCFQIGNTYCLWPFDKRAFKIPSRVNTFNNTSRLWFQVAENASIPSTISRTRRINFLAQCVQVKVSRACPYILIEHFIPCDLESLNSVSSSKVTTPIVTTRHLVRKENHAI